MKLATIGGIVQSVALGAFVGVLALGCLLLVDVLSSDDGTLDHPMYAQANETINANGCLYEEGKPRTKLRQFSVTYSHDEKTALLRYDGRTETLKFERSTLLSGDDWEGPNFSLYVEPELFLSDKIDLLIGPLCD